MMRLLSYFPIRSYQIYEGAAFLASAEPYHMNCVKNNKFLPDFDAVPDNI